MQEVLNPDDAAKRCDLLLALGEALLPAGEYQRVFERTALAAFEVAESLGDNRRASRACQLATDGLHRYGSVTAMSTPLFRDWAERADRYAPPGTC